MTQPEKIEISEKIKKPNWFVRILIIFLCLFICGLIYFNFFGSTYFGINASAEITTPLLFLIAFLMVLVLSEAFNNFSIGQLITLSRTVEKKEETNKELKKENQELRNQILTISTSISQKQINTQVVLSEELAKMLTVKPANDEEKQQKEKEVEETQTVITGQTPRKYISLVRFEEVALTKFLQSKGLQIPFIRDAKLTSHFEQIDPISEYSPIFDCYIKTIDKEVFIELRPFARTAFIHTREKIYVMLSKINYYRTIKKATAFLFLVFYSRPEDDIVRGQSLIEQLKKEFEPARSNGLLQIEQIEITQEEYDKIVKGETNTTANKSIATSGADTAQHQQ